MFLLFLALFLPRTAADSPCHCSLSGESKFHTLCDSSAEPLDAISVEEKCRNASRFLIYYGSGCVEQLEVHTLINLYHFL